MTQRRHRGQAKGQQGLPQHHPMSRAWERAMGGRRNWRRRAGALRPASSAPRRPAAPDFERALLIRRPLGGPDDARQLAHPHLLPQEPRARRRSGEVSFHTCCSYIPHGRLVHFWDYRVHPGNKANSTDERHHWRWESTMANLIQRRKAQAQGSHNDAHFLVTPPTRRNGLDFRLDDLQ